MTIITTTLSNGIYVPSTSIPLSAVEVVVNGSGSYTVVAEDDFYSPTPPTSFLNYVTNLFAGNLGISPSYFGITYNGSPLGVGDADQAVISSIARSHDYSGPQSNLTPVQWRVIEPNAPVNGVHTYNWSQLDIFVGYHRARGRDICHTLVTTPVWASARPTEAAAYGVGTGAEPTDLTNWDAYCTATATRYKGLIKYYEIWNEVNAITNPFWTGTQTMLSQMVRRAAQAIKAVDPLAQVISPSTIGWQNSGGTGSSYFLAMMSASDGATGTMAQWVDIISAHFYTQNYAALMQIGSQIVPNVRAAMTAAGVASKPLWNTEYGQFSPGLVTLTKSIKERIIRRMMITACANNAGPVARSFWYSADNIVMGFNTDDIAVYNDMQRILLTGPITVVNQLRDGRVAIVVGGKRYIW